MDSNTSTVNQLLLVLQNIGCLTLYQLSGGVVSLVTLIVVPYVQTLPSLITLLLLLLKVWYSRPSYRP